MNTSRIAPVSAKLKRGVECYLNGKPVYIERDPQDGTIFICDHRSLHPEHNFWWVNKSDLQQQPKFGSSIKSKPKKATEAELSEEKQLNAFFDSLKIPFSCTNCRKPLYVNTKKAKRSVCSHILPKAIFKSIATNPYNIYFLGADYLGYTCDCHDRWGKNLQSRMHKDLTRVYDFSIRRYHEHLKKELTPHEQMLAEEYLGLTVKSGNLLKDIQEGWHE